MGNCVAKFKLCNPESLNPETLNQCLLAGLLACWASIEQALVHYNIGLTSPTSSTLAYIETEYPVKLNNTIAYIRGGLI